ncbi:MAG: nitroreductase family protein [Anaerolineae bacterium]|nr:nitroreductase family protein [Anaerolineae bacterium]
MEFDRVIARRRSIRSYEDRDVDDDAIGLLLAYGHAAPSAGNLHPWEFIVVRDPAQRRRIVDTTFRGNDFDGTAHQEWLMEAPVLIVVVANRAKSAARYGEKAIKSLVYLDCSACIENILLGAANLSLASCYISGFREPELRAVLGLPDTHEAIAFLPIGYGADEGQPRPKTPLAEIIHHESYRGAPLSSSPPPGGR